MAFPRRGGYYLVWKKGKKNIQSNIYQSKGQDPIFPKELLSLSLKVYYQGGMPQPRHVRLFIVRLISYCFLQKGNKYKEPN